MRGAFRFGKALTRLSQVANSGYKTNNLLKLNAIQAQLLQDHDDRGFYRLFICKSGILKREEAKESRCNRSRYRSLAPSRPHALPYANCLNERFAPRT